MSTKVIMSVSAGRRLGHAQDWLRERGKGEEVLIVGATLAAAGELARNAARTNGVAFGWHRHSWAQFVRALAGPLLARHELVPITRVSVDAVVTGLIHRLRGEGKLGVYQSVAGTPGFHSSIVDMLSELRLAGVNSDAVSTTAPDLAPIVGAYEAELTEKRYCDLARLLALADEALQKRLHRFAGMPIALLDVPLRNRGELQLISTIASAAPAMLVTIPASDTESAAKLRDTLGVPYDDLDGTPAQGESLLSNLQRNLFSGRDTAPRPADASVVEVFSAPGENRECVEIVRQILALADTGLSFDRMAVLLRSPAEYRAHLAEAFARADIPVHFARGAVRPDPSGRAFCALLECAADNLSAQRFAEYLALGQVPDAEADGTPPQALPQAESWVAPDNEEAVLASAAAVPLSPAQETDDEGGVDRPVVGGSLRAPWRWERLLVDAAVIGGLDRWRRRLEGLTNELRLAAEREEDDESGADRAARAFDEIKHFSAYALPLISELAALPSSASWGVWLEALSALATRSIRRPDRILSILAELAPMSDAGPVSVNDVLGVLRGMLLETFTPPTTSRYGCVFIGPIESARGLSFDVVFVPGMAEKMFPQKIIEEPLLLDVKRVQLGQDLATNPSRLENERVALGLAIGAAETRVCLSFPRIDLDQARPRVPSFYALEALRAAEGRLPDFAELGRRAEAASESRLGWPAPLDPKSAIDDAEHDLSVLADLTKGRAATAGAARYLVTANRHLARALRNRFLRWKRSWTPADGLLAGGPATRSALDQHGFAQRSYSPTSLQAYAQCPYRFFLKSIHGLSPREVPASVDVLDPLQRGSLIHDIHFELLGRLRDKGMLPVAPNNLAQAYLELDEVIAAVAARYRDELAPAIERIWENGVTAIRGDMREWLRRSSEDSSGFVPIHFELAFGLKDRGGDPHDRDPASQDGPVLLDCGIQLRGSIDLVERQQAGLLRVTDHKTGKATAKSDQVINGGQTLQPVLYALAAERLFNQDVVGGRLYFSTSIGGFSEVLVELDDFARDAATHVATTIKTALESPFLAPAPAKGECERCDYRAVCGPYEELRVARKPQERLKPLTSLRDVR
jgi:ATP-dependent helicase/nuclease subunit B